MRHMIRTWLKEEELKVVEYEVKKVHYYNLEKGPLPREDEDGAMDEIQDSHIFKTNEFFVDVSMEYGG